MVLSIKQWSATQINTAPSAPPHAGGGRQRRPPDASRKTLETSRHNAIDSNGPGYQSPGQQPPAFRSTATDLLVCARGTGRPGPRFRRQVLTDHLCSRVSYPFTSDEFHPSLIRDGQHDSGEVGTDRVVLRETEKRYFLPHPSKHDTKQSLLPYSSAPTDELDINTTACSSQPWLQSAIRPRPLCERSTKFDTPSYVCAG